jgi:hypothetical protein
VLVRNCKLPMQLVCSLAKNIRGSSNGRTTAFEAVYLGSNPSPRANEVIGGKRANSSARVLDENTAAMSRDAGRRARPRGGAQPEEAEADER